MSIAAVSGSTQNNSSSGTSLAFSSASFTLGNMIVVAVSVSSASVSVSSISDGVNTYTLQSFALNSTVRSEIWTAPVTTGGTLTITVTLSGSALASACYEQYSGVTAIGNVGTGLLSASWNALGSVTLQDSGSFAVSAMAIGTSSGDTATGSVGTIRRSVIPALTTTATLLMDVTSVTPSYVSNVASLSAVRSWAVTTVELRSGGGGLVVEAPPYFAPTYIRAVLSTTPNTTYAPGVPVTLGSVLQGGITGTAYSETLTGSGGTPGYTFAVVSGSLPAGLTLDTATGIISGTPTTAATSTFSAQCTDSVGNVGPSIEFQITIADPSAGGGGGDDVGAIAVTGLSTTDQRVTAFVVELYSDSGLTTLVDTESAHAVYDASAGATNMVGTLVFRGLTVGTTYYLRSCTIIPGFGPGAFSSTYSVTAGTDTATGMTNPMTTKGDIIVGDTSGAPVRLAPGTAGQVLTSNGAGAKPTYQDVPSGFGTTSGSNSNGFWVKDSNGYIRQWGKVATDINGGTLAVTFPTAFTDATKVSVAVSTKSSTDRITYVVDGSLTTTGFTIGNNGSSGYAYWSAEGY
jgi:large repetitive protein